MKKQMGRGMVLILFLVAMSAFLLPRSAEAETMKRTVRIGYIDYEGFIVQEQEGSYEGYGVDYLNAIGEITGWNYEYVYDTWENHMEALKEGRLDFICHAQKTPEREVDYIFSQYSVGAETNVLYARKDDSRYYYDDFRYMDGIRVALLEGSYQNDEFDDFARMKGFSYEAVYYETSKECFDALDAGLTDAVAMGSMAGKEGYKVLSRFGSAPCYIMAGKANQTLMMELSMAQGELLAEDPSFQADLFTDYYKNSAAEVDLLFTREEMEYISNSDAITVGQLIARYPISYTGEDGLYGINEDILKKISEMSGLDLHSVPLEAGESPVAAAKSGKYDVVMGTIDNLKYRNDAEIVLSKPYMKGTLAMVMRPGEVFNPGGEAVVGLKHSFQYMQEYIEEKYPNFKIKYYDDNETILRDLTEGKVDIMTENVYVIEYLLQKPMYEKLEIVSTTYIEEENCFVALNDEDDMLMDILNRCISHFSEESMNEIILQNTSAKPYKLTIADMAYKYRIEFVIIAGLLLTCFVLLGMTAIFRQRHAKQMENKNEQLAVAVTVAENANQAKSRFLSQMSHEIRTPMNAIVGITNIAKEHMKEPDKMSYYLEKIAASSEVLLHIINDVLDMSAIESGKIRIDSSPFDLKACLQGVFEMYETQCKNKEIEFSLQTDIQHTMVIGDSLRVNQILLNLISNALKFTGRGGKITIKATEKQVNENVAFMEFTIEDTGCGMSEEMLKRLYQPFEQESVDIARKFGGSGLGTTIAKALIELMEGAIEVESVQGKGTTFFIDIPFEIFGEAPADREENGGWDFAAYDFSGCRVLLVEDNELNAEIAGELLEQVHLQVDYAVNGAEGVKMFEESEPGTYQIILMDVQMPVMDGWEATKAIRKGKHPEGTSVPIYAMTANAFREDVAVSLSSGMNGHIAKPIDTKTLYQVLERELK